MRVVLLGTGGAAGWPNPFCTCASCTDARSRGEVRGQTAALVDDVLLLDCGPEVPRAAERLGHPLTGLRHLLLTHAHADHAAPPVLLWREWANRTDPLDVIGPPAAIAAVREWTDSPTLHLREVRAGEELTVGAYTVRVLAANHPEEVGPPVLYDITGPDHTRLLYSTDTGELPAATYDAVAGAAYDAVFLEETFGDQDGAPLGHLDLASFPRVLARLRAGGAVVEDTKVVAIHLGAENPPAAELGRRLAAWGVTMPADGTVVDISVAAQPQPQPRRVLVLGGARSGKSQEAERRLLAEPAVTYVATARPRPDDAEWTARVAAHRARRPVQWTTVETDDLPGALRGLTGPVLVDCLTLWLAGVLDDGADVDAAIDNVVAAWRATAGSVVAVSNEVGAGVVPASAAGRAFRDALGVLNARLAAESDEVWAMTAGIAQRLR